MELINIPYRERSAISMFRISLVAEGMVACHTASVSYSVEI